MGKPSDKNFLRTLENGVRFGRWVGGERLRNHGADLLNVELVEHAWMY